MTEITWLGQMGLIVKTESTAVCIDYYASDDAGRLTPVPIAAGDIKGIDAFLGTHDHLDHIDHESWKVWAQTCPDARFIFPMAHKAAVLSDGVSPEKAVGLNDGESVRIGDITVRAIAASHEFLDRDPVTGQYPYLQYIIEAGGLRIHHAGDTVRYEGMLGKVTAYGPVDVELLPINGRDAKRYRNNCIGNMTYQEAADFAGDAGARVVIPGHWNMFEGNTADPYAFADYISAKYGTAIRCIVPRVGEQLFF